MTFKARLRMEMQKKGLNAKGLAASAGISVNTLNMYIGYREAIPSAETAVKLAKALSVTVEYLMEGTPVRPAARKDSADLVAKDSSGDDDGVSLSIEYLIRMEIAKTPRLRLPLLLRLIRAFNQAENPPQPEPFGRGKPRANLPARFRYSGTGNPAGASSPAPAR